MREVSVMGRTRRAGALGVVALLLSVATSSLAQDETPVHRLETRLAVGSISLRDDLLVPYAFTGPMLALAGRYEHERGPHLLDAGFRAAMAPMWTRERELGIDALHELYARYARRVLRHAQRDTSAGPSLRYTHELAYLADWDDAHGYWLASLLAGVYAKHREMLRPRVDLELGVDLGFVGLRSRPPARRLNKQDALNHVDFFFNRLGDDPRFAWLFDTLQLRFDAMLRVRRAHRPHGAGWAIGYESRVSWTHDPRPFTAWYNGVAAAYAWSWP